MRFPRGAPHEWAILALGNRLLPDASVLKLDVQTAVLEQQKSALSGAYTFEQKSLRPGTSLAETPQAGL